MFRPIEPFELKVNTTTIRIREVEIPGYRAFQTIFSSKREPITIVRATNRKGDRFWTTIPENEARQKEAEGLGNLIQEYLAKLEQEK
jgi:hypothetical protein